MSPDYAKLWEAYPIELDGWAIGHRMFIRDQKKFIDATAALLAQSEANVALALTQRSALGNFFQRWLDFLHHHHQGEEDIIFPYLVKEKKVELEPKLSQDHKYFIEQVEKCSVLVKAVAGGKQDPQGDASTLKELLDIFTALDAHLKEHYDEEESTVLPLIRENITPEEQIKYLNKPIVAGFTWKDRGQFFSMFDDENFRKFAAQERIPFFAVWIIKWDVHSYKKKFAAPVDAAIAASKDSIAAGTA